MGLLIFENKLIATQTGESVLAALLRSGVDVPHDCQAGVCQSCLMQAEEGFIPAVAQNDLTQEQKNLGCFLACQCRSFKRLKVKRYGG